MFPVMEWWGYAVIAALPLLGFALGARWWYWHERLNARLPQPQAQPPALPPSPGFETGMVNAVESMQRQLEELAERQDFAERLLAQRQGQLPPADRQKVHTPV